MADIDTLLADDDMDSDLVRNLRSALKEANKELKDVRATLGDRAKADRTRDLAELLKSKELPEKVAKLYPSDADVTAEAVDAWLSDYGDVFGIQQPGTTADAATVEAAQRVTAMTAGAPPAHRATDIESLAAEIKAAKTPQEYDAVMAKLNMR